MRASGPKPGGRFAIQLLLLTSGAAALMHEVAWTRRLVDLLGSSAESITRVLGCFFLGLALGAGVAAFLLRRRVSNPWRIAAACEGAVAGLALPIVWLPELTTWVWPLLGLERLASWWGGSVKLLISALVILPPALAMGMVVPLVVAGLAPGRKSGIVTTAYAVNTLGGGIGLILVTLVTLPLFGTRGATLLAGGLNLLVAAGFFALRSFPSTDNAIPETRAPADRAWRGSVLLAFFSGAAVLAAEVASANTLMLIATLSFYAPAAILLSVLAMLALASFFAPSIGKKAGLPVVLAMAAVATAAGPLIFMEICQRVNPLATNSSPEAFFFKLALLTAVSYGPGFFFAGLVFPLLLEKAGGTRADRVGWLLAFSGAGGVIGAEAVVRGLLPAVGIHASMGVIALAYGAVALAVALAFRASAVVPVTAAILILAAIYPRLAALPVVNAHAGLSLLDERTGREGNVAVVESERLGRVILLSNQYLLGGSHARWDQERQALLPLLLAPRARDVAFIGIATGVTPGAALALPQIRSLTAVELSPLVARAAKVFFGDINRGLFGDPRARIVIEDGRTYIAASPGRFDVVIGDLFLPWAPGEARLYSLEHFQAMKRALKPGGVGCQWLAMYQLTPAQFEIIAATFRKVFPNAHLFMNGFTCTTPALALVGAADDSSPDWKGTAERATAAAKAGSVTDPLLRHPEGIGMLYLGPLEAADSSPNTLANLAIEVDAGRQRLSGDAGARYFFGSRWLEFCESRRRRIQASVAPAVPPEILSAGALAQACALEEARARFDRLPPLHARLLQAIPASIAADSRANWDAWTGCEAPWRSGMGEAFGDPNASAR